MSWATLLFQWSAAATIVVKVIQPIISANRAQGWELSFLCLQVGDKINYIKVIEGGENLINGGK
jgi:hypothetical protein